MIRLERKDYMVAGGLSLLWLALLLIPPLIDFYVRRDMDSAWVIFTINASFIFPMAVVFLINYYLLIPRSLYRSRKWLFALVNMLVVIGFSYKLFMPNEELPAELRSGLHLAIFGVCFLCLLVIGSAVGLRYIARWNEMQMRLKEERQKSSEAELAWLKNQLNPHFLFNTLNNISSLVQIDADTAQESIGQLSDLLRYSLYESNQGQVPLSGEMEFMRNYIDLMRLRCNEQTVVTVDFREPSRPMQVAPLLFISLIENAFKHGMSSRTSSFIHISLHTKDDSIIFTCENSNHPKQDINRSGSGIGLENLKRRLELAYQGRYVYQQQLRGDVYYVEVRLKVCV